MKPVFLFSVSMVFLAPSVDVPSPACSAAKHGRLPFNMA